MERCLTWYLLSLKIFTKKKIYYLQLLMILLVVFIVYKIQIPQFDTVKVGVCYSDSSFGKEIFKTLEESDGVFRYITYLDTEQLKVDVFDGQLEGGFVFTDLFDKGIVNGETKDTVLFYSTPFSMKAEVLKETVYTAIFNYISEQILIEVDEEQYGNSDDERRKRLLELNTWYLESDSLFKLEIEEVIVRERENLLYTAETYPIRGTAGLLVFLIMYLAHGRKWEADSKAVLNALSHKDRILYMAMVMLGSATIPSIMVVGFLTGLAESGGIIFEIMKMIMLIVISILWITILDRIIRNYTTYMSSVVAILLVNVFCCPIFVDLATIVPAMKYVRMVLPLGWYL